jgi:hypothetical protein
MTLVVPNAAEERFLDAILATNYTLRLFKNDVTSGLTAGQIEALTVSSFTEATFTGYSGKTLTGGSWTTTAGDPSTGTYAQQQFTSSADQTAQTIYGYYVARTTGGALDWFEYFTAPVVVEFTNDAIRVTPRITLADTGD